LSINKICTSLAIGFYVKDRPSFDIFKAELTELARMPDSFFSVFERSKPRKAPAKESGTANRKSGTMSGKNSRSPPRNDKSFLAYHEQVTKGKQTPQIGAMNKKSLAKQMSPERPGERQFVRLSELQGDDEGFEIIN